MSASQLADDLKVTLAKRVRRTLDVPSAKRAGVLILLYSKDGTPHLLFTRRSREVAFHRGEVSFPGGQRDKVDPSLLHTALREAWEELGIRIGEEQVLGALDDVYTAKSNYLISAYAAYTPSLGEVRPNRREISDVIEVPLAALLDPSNVQEEQRVIDGVQRPIQFYRYGDYEIWGVTARILRQFIELLPPRGRDPVH